MRWKDFKGLFKKSYPQFESVENPHSDYYLVRLKADQSFTWEAGEHSIFWLPDNNVEGQSMRAFSIASIPEEDILLIGFRTGETISSFKKEMINMNPGDRVGMRGPFGSFKFKDKTSPVVMIAAGVGITPFRSLLKEIEHDISREVHLIYTSREFHLFGGEIETIVKNNPKITLYKKHHRGETQESLMQFVEKFENNAYYFICGKPAMTESTKEILIERGVHKKRIINDPFKGY